ncbi:MAG: VWA domain-containing protein [Candidatus Aenigmarchaeota archaeon]|nr:VWA domain-containing protein [Candidatus Aenigmarchaeota archaeon]
MNRSSFLILVSLVCIAITLVVGISFWNVIMRGSMDVPIYDDVRERTDIILSDRIPIGCFIPPDSKAEDVYTSVFNDNDLRESCLEIGKEMYIEPGFWDENINNSLKYGIKLNGYCNDSDRKGCLCMKDDFPGWSEDGMLLMRRSLDFGTEYEPVRAIGEELNKQGFVGLKNQPSVFVVMLGEEPKLSVYGGMKLRGDRTVEKVTAALYKGTVSDDANRISEFTGIERSCYWGDKWTKYQSCRNSASENSKIDCRMKYDCYTDERYYNENTSTICKNYCDVDFTGNEANCMIGCGKGEERECYRKCYVKTGDADECARAGVCDCLECVSIEEYDLINNFCEGLSGDVKKGCENFTYFEKSTFQVNSSEYTNFKIGDLEWTGGNYKGLAWVVSKITTREQHPGDSCYNPNHFNCYYNCWEGVCEEARDASPSPLDLVKALCDFQDSKLLTGGITIPYDISGSEIWALGVEARTECEDSCKCSTTNRTETENTFILCRNFCISRDGFYKDTEKVNSCVNGCEWASRIYDKPEYLEFEKNVDLVFVVDTSGSMCQSGSNEWSSLCGIIESIVASVGEEDYIVDVTVYGLGSKKCGGTNYCADKIISGHSESWGPGAEWAIKNHPWREDILSKIVFVVGDEGPYAGDPWTPQNDRDSVENAVIAANDNKVTIFGLWGIGIAEGLKDLFRDISEPTGGSATKFDTADPSEVVELITDAIKKDIEFELGYGKYEELLRNSLPADSPYIWREVYEEVFSNLVYIVDWKGSASSWSPWSYPCDGNWDKICTSDTSYNKSFELNPMLEEIKDLY